MKATTRINLLNGLGVAVAMLIAGWLTHLAVARSAGAALSATASQGTTDRNSMQDASQRIVRLRPFRRIASASMVADPVLREICPPDRIVAYSAHARRVHDAQRFLGKPIIEDDLNPEVILALAPDLLLVSNLSLINSLQRLRESGITIFDLGEMKGVETLLKNIRVIGKLVDREAEAGVLADRFGREMGAIAGSGQSGTDRPGAMYVGYHGGLLTGGTRGTSFHDVLISAGFRDVAADDFFGWPRYGVEQLLLLDPEIIVTQEGAGPALCRQTGLDRLRACQTPGSLLQLPSTLILDPGLAMVEAARRLHDAYFSDRQR